ncbi:MAG TPA: DUF1326 domain-containing protein [Pseudonocardia sp.]|nr:DUF1326 domain-containing protein [Pseudonocardia sp.]
MDTYLLAGRFVEACDCSLICPCWLDDDPDEDHCTGLFAWHIEEGTINGQPVDGRRVVSVSTHTGGRRDRRTSTALFVDDGATDAQRDLLCSAFAGELEGPLRDLAAVTGVVLQRERARIDLVETATDWQVTVRPAASPEHLVSVTAAQRVFRDETRPLTLHTTALHRELAVPGDGAVTAYRGGELSVHVPVLPAGYTDVNGRSGMAGRFRYRHPVGEILT